MPVASRLVTFAGWLAIATALGVAPARADDWLVGEWYVLVHFEEQAAPGQDDAAFESRAQGERDPVRFEAPGAGVDYRDVVWRFQREGAALRWTILPDLAFVDEAGRFEEVRGTRARLRHAWRPTRSQLEEIRRGVAVDERSARSKRLSRSGSGFASRERPRGSSASAVAFGESWTLDGLDATPVFEIAASLSSGRAEALEGVTRFAATSVDPAAGRIEGDYARDARERGRFWMWRKGRVDPGDAAFATGDASATLLGPGGLARSDVAELQALIARARTPAGRDDPTLRRAIRAAIGALVEESYVRSGRSLRRDRAEIDAAVGEIERLAVVEGVALEEIDRRFAPGAPAGSGRDG